MAKYLLVFSGTFRRRRVVLEAKSPLDALEEMWREKRPGEIAELMVIQQDRPKETKS